MLQLLLFLLLQVTAPLADLLMIVRLVRDIADSFCSARTTALPLLLFLAVMVVVGVPVVVVVLVAVAVAVAVVAAVAVVLTMAAEKVDNVCSRSVVAVLARTWKTHMKLRAQLQLGSEKLQLTILKLF